VDSIVLLAENNSSALNNLYKKVKQLAPELKLVVSTTQSPFNINSNDYVVLLGDNVPSHIDLSTLHKSIAIMVTKNQSKRLNVKTSVWAEPPLKRQFELANLVIPGKSKVGLLVNGAVDKQIQIASLDESQREMLNIVDISEYDNLNQALYNVLKESKLILASYNNTIYNAKNIKNILITSYRQQKVLIGPSRAFLRAGSFATTFSNMDNIAQRLVDIIQYHKNTGIWLSADYNPHYRILFNQQVARSLDVPLVDVELLRQQMIETKSP
jgi:hypothetical protein